jgi:hypothetical protein
MQNENGRQLTCTGRSSWPETCGGHCGCGNPPHQPFWLQRGLTLVHASWLRSPSTPPQAVGSSPGETMKHHHHYHYLPLIANHSRRRQHTIQRRIRTHTPLGGSQEHQTLGPQPNPNSLTAQSLSDTHRRPPKKEKISPLL